jgi:Tol biopolymer transport system component
MSPDGTRVLFTRRASVGGAAGAVGPLNALFLLDSQSIGDSGIALGVEDVLYADWLSNGQIIYSTGERTVGAPGWKAHNDLWTYDLAAHRKAVVLAPLSGIEYAFWGVSFALAPDRKRIVFAAADALGFVEVSSGTLNVLQQFPALETNAGWVWTPDVTWSPDMRFVAATLHAPPPETPRPELAQLFDVWVLSTNGSFAAPLAPDTGMFANPVWSRQGSIAYAQARHPRDSADDQYDVFVMNADGGNKRRIFPLQGDHGLTNPQFEWSSDGERLLVLQDGNLYVVSGSGKSAAQLTADGGGTQLRWR